MGNSTRAVPALPSVMLLAARAAWSRRPARRPQTASAEVGSADQASTRPAGGRGHRDPPRGGPQQGADQRHGADPGRHGPEGHQGLPGHRALHPRRQHRHLGHQRRFRSAASPLPPAPARPASIWTTRRSRCARSASIPTIRCRRPSTWQRVEVLRGPQGTLFGSGSEGGTVRYILTEPSTTLSSTYVRAEARLHPVRRAELRARRGARPADHRRHTRLPCQRLVSLRRRLDQPRRSDHRRADRGQRQPRRHSSCCAWPASGSRPAPSRSRRA